MTIQVADHFAKKKVVHDMSGNIIDLYDETQGGWIIQKRQVVNQERWGEILKKQKDDIEAAKAQSLAVNNPNAPDRNINPQVSTANKERLDELEKKVGDMDSKLDVIIKSLNK
jgi:hypothetical protein